MSSNIKILEYRQPEIIAKFTHYNVIQTFCPKKICNDSNTRDGDSDGNDDV